MARRMQRIDPVADRMLARVSRPAVPARRGFDDVAIAAFDDHQLRRNFSPGTVRCRRSVLVAFQRHLGDGLLVATRREVEEWLDTVALGPQGALHVPQPPPRFLPLRLARGHGHRGPHRQHRPATPAQAPATASRSR